MPDCTPSLTASQSRIPRRRYGYAGGFAQSAQLNLGHTQTPKSLTYFLTVPKATAYLDIGYSVLDIGHSVFSLAATLYACVGMPDVSTKDTRSMSS